MYNPIILVLSLYRASSGYVNEFTEKLDATLKYLCKQKSEFIICMDMGINYFIQNKQKKQVSSILKTCNLPHIVNFSTRIQNSRVLIKFL